MDNELLNEESVSQQTPKRLLYIFKIYGVLILAFSVLSGALNLTAVVADFSVFTLITFLPVAGVIISSVILGYGCYKLKRWVIPILALGVINGIINFLIDSSVNQILVFAYLLAIILFFLAYFYRQNFIGSYKAYPVYIIYGVSLVLVLSGFFIMPKAQISLNNKDIQETITTTLSDSITLQIRDDLNYIGTALDLYYAKNKAYPVNLMKLQTSGYISNIPESFLKDESYNYCVSSDLNAYNLGAILNQSSISSEVMEDSFQQSQTSCLLRFDRICGLDNYYCRGSQSSSKPAISSNEEVNSESDSLDEVPDAIAVARAKSRNTIRISDIGKIVLAQELYYDEGELYKYAPTIYPLVEAGILGKIPKDPITDADYDYCLTQNLQGFAVGTQLEAHQDLEIMMSYSDTIAEIPCLLPKACGVSGYFCSSTE